MPEISIVIPAYNREALIGETLASVRAQTLRDYEVFVVDDGSTDDTEARVRGMDSRFRYLRVPHSGPGAARNAGLALAASRYVAFLDSDDWWGERCLEKLESALDGCPQAGFAYCDYATFDARGEIEPACLKPKYKQGGDLFGALLEEDFVCTGGLLFRRECLVRFGGFDASLPVVEDWDLWLRVAREFDAVYVDEPLVHIRLDATHLGRTPELVYTCNLRVLSKIKRDFPEEARRAHAIIRRQEARFHRALVDYYRSEGRTWATFRQLAYVARSRLRSEAE